MAEHKLLGILLAIGLCLVAGVFFLIDTEDTTTRDTLGTTVDVTPPAETAGVAASDSRPTMGTPLPPGSPLAGKVLVSQRPVQVLSSPNPTASALYSLPVGRPFRAVAKEGNYLRIHDVNSGAGGWIEQAALAPAPAQRRADEPSRAASPSTSRRTTTTSSPPRQTSRVTSSPTREQPKRRSGGIFSGNGPFRGLFGN
ncbi:MAG: hypothetical protein QNJ62_07860 [Methyloceanibacter sp.]|nr:hypothetical protein [Methyloceanibacter sp.]